MTQAGPRPSLRPAAADRWRAVRGLGHLLVLALVVAGVAAVLTQPSAPPIDEPLPATTWFPESHLETVEDYQEPRDLVLVAGVVVRLGLAAVVALSRPGRELVARLAERLAPWAAAGVVLAGAALALDLLLLPLSFWSGYVHDGAWGLRTQGLAGWVRDWLVTHPPTWLGAGLAGAVGWALAGRFPRGWPPLLALLGAVTVGVLALAYPLVLQPLEHRTAPLEDGPTRDAVDAVVAAAGAEEIEAVLVADASRRTTRQNAFVSGLGATRQIVLYDTLVAARPPEEVAAVVAHEVAHHQHRDIARGALTAAAAIAVGIYALAGILVWRTRRGAQRHPADPRAAGVVAGLVLVALVVSTPVEAGLSRRMEAAADWGALHLTEDPGGYERVKVEMALANLGRPDPPAWRHLWSGTHPTRVERLTMAEVWRERYGAADPSGAVSGAARAPQVRLAEGSQSPQAAEQAVLGPPQPPVRVHRTPPALR